MIQQEKQLLLIDLCARLPYGVKCLFNYGTVEDAIILKCIDGDVARFNYGWYGEFHVTIEPKYFKPYLRPMKSMTEEEGKDYHHITERWMYDAEYSIADSIDWLNARHFDYRGLIDMGLALKAPEGMYMTIKKSQQ